MNVLMYHYVRPAPADLPYFRYLHRDDFAAQIDALARQNDIITAGRFLEILAGAPVPDRTVLLTFDDGLTDHYDHVLPVLEERKLTGLFFVLADPPVGGELWIDFLHLQAVVEKMVKVFEQYIAARSDLS